MRAYLAAFDQYLTAARAGDPVAVRAAEQARAVTLADLEKGG